MVFDLFSKRQQRLRGEVHDVYVYDKIPDSLRVQVVYLWHDVLGEPYTSAQTTHAYKLINETLRKEYGKFSLSGKNTDHHHKDLVEFFRAEQNPDRVIDVIEVSFIFIDARARRGGYGRTSNPSTAVDKAISDLNIRFKEHGLGYEFTKGEIVRIDSELIHAEVVKPVLRLLEKPHLRGAEDEYLRAHQHYRHGNAKEALNECLKAFESAMMGICKKRGWPYGEKDSAKTLLDICFKNELVPEFWQSQMGGLRSLLEGGVPTVRNKLSGHGQGAAPTEVPPHIVGYVMHMTASALKFLAEADEALA